MNPLLRTYRPLLIGGSAIAAGLGGYLYLSRNDERRFYRPIGWDAWIKTAHEETFQMRLPYGAWGVGNDHFSSHILLSEEECEKKLKAQETSTIVRRAGNMVVRWDTGVLGSNQPCEDRHAVDLIPRSSLNYLRNGDTTGLPVDAAREVADGQAPLSFWERWGKVKNHVTKVKDEESKVHHVDHGPGEDDILMVSVLDGHGSHGGFMVAELMRKVLHPTLAYALASGEGGLPDKLPTSFVERWGVTANGDPWQVGKVTKTIYDTILALDNDLLRTPLTLFRNHLADPTKDPLLPHPAPSLVHLATLDTSGACATTAIIDAASDKLYVSNLGDCRAVAGWYDPKTGQRRCDVISEIGDVNGDNDEEADRLRARHPIEEWDDVVCNLGHTGRVLGNCQITRAFGDAGNKRQINDIAKMREAVDVQNCPQKKPYLTPPYMLGEAEVLYRDLHPASGEELKFLIMATDGLWDTLSSEEATLLMSAHMTDPSAGKIAKTDLASRYKFQPPIPKRPYPVEDLPGTTAENSQGTWSIQDDNAATHLIRNCVARGDDWERRRILSMKDGTLRELRDDITTVVLMFDEQPTSA